MKKITLFSMLILFVSLIIGAQSIKIVSPKSGTWNQGQLLKIVWKKSGTQQEFVKIRLFSCNGKQKILGISDRTPNDGQFSWTIPNSVSDGKYLIRVKTVNNKVFKDSICFSIVKKQNNNPPPNDTNKGSNNDPNKIYRLKDPNPNTGQIDPKYMPEKNVFNPNFTPKNNNVQTTGKLIPEKEIVPFGSNVRIVMEFTKATRLKVVNKTFNKVLFDKPVTFSKSKSKLSITVPVTGVIIQYEMEVWGPKTTYISACWIKTIPKINNFSVRTIGKRKIFSYSFIGCDYAFLKKSYKNSNNWKRVEKLTGNNPFAKINETKSGTYELVTKDINSYRYKLVLIGDNGVVASHEVK